MDITVDCRFQVGDVVRWIPGKETMLEKLGPGPFVVEKIHISYGQVYVFLLDQHNVNGWYEWRFELDPFLTAVHRRRHPQGTTQGE